MITNDVSKTRQQEFIRDRLRMEAFLDADDIESFNQSLDNLKKEYPEKNYLLGHDFSLMYSGTLGDQKSVAVFREKHGDRFHDISTPDDFSNTFLGVLQERLADGYYSAYPLSPAKSSRPFLDIFVKTMMFNIAMTEVLVKKINEETSIDYRQTAKEWREHLLTSALRDAMIPSDEVWRYVQEMLTQNPKPSEQTDAVMAWLLYITVSNDLENTGSAVKEYFFNYEMGPITQGLLNVLPKSQASEVQDILKTATEANKFRLAGRLAYGFLSARQRGEYEGFSVYRMQPAIFKHAEKTPKI